MYDTPTPSSRSPELRHADEFIEIVTWLQLKNPPETVHPHQHNGYYDGFLAFLDQAMSQGSSNQKIAADSGSDNAEAGFGNCVIAIWKAATSSSMTRDSTS